MSVTTRSLHGALAAIVGAGRVRDDAAALAAAAVDGETPRWVAAPATLEEVGRVLALAREETLAIVPRGSGSALQLGRPPARVDGVIDLRRLDAVVEYNPDDVTISVQAGITAGALAARLATHRQALPLDPPGWAGRTLGGIAATGASGPLRMRYGTMRDLLLGARFAQADGVVTWGGARVVKSVSGYDVPKLLVGSLGTLGVLGELTLRLHPVPAAEATLLATFGGPEAAQAFVARVIDGPLQPSRLEYLDARALRACGLPAAPAALAISVATVEPAVRAQQAALADIAGRERGTVETMGPAFWSTYDQVTAEAGAVTVRVATLATRLAPTVGEIAAALGDDRSAVVTASPVLGTLRAAFAGADAAAAVKVIERLRAFVAPADGSVIVERAPRAVRAAIDPWGPVPEAALAIMRGLKDAFDPSRVLNPGRFAGGL